MTAPTTVTTTVGSGVQRRKEEDEVKTILDCIEDKYAPDPEGAGDFGFIVFVSNSPETKKGMFPPIMTLIDYDIEEVGTHNRTLETRFRGALYKKYFHCDIILM
jgi:hypothetical protein